MKIRFAGVALLPALWLAGCGTASQAPESGGGGSPAARSGGAASAAKGQRDPCSLLDPKEVEAVIGPLAGPPFRTSGGSTDNSPSDQGDACVYEATDYSTVRLSVEWEDGAMLLKAVTLPTRMLSGGADAPGKDAVVKNMLPGGVQLAGEWDEAASLGCCQIFALRGDTLVTFDFMGWRNDMRRAAGLLDKALVRVESPLAIDGRAGNAAAAKRAADRPGRRDPCSLLTRAEVESILGPLLADPKAGGDGASCVYRFTQAASEDSTLKDAPDAFKSMITGMTGGKTGLVSGPVDVALTVQWRGGFRWLHESLMVSGATAGAFGGMPGMPKRQMGAVEGPWAEGMQTSLAFTAVKNDVAVSADTVPMLSNQQVELRRRLVTAAIGKI